jgi:hypothetical protein
MQIFSVGCIILRFVTAQSLKKGEFEGGIGTPRPQHPQIRSYSDTVESLTGCSLVNRCF